MLLWTHVSSVVRASGADDDCAALYDEGCNGVLTAAWLDCGVQPVLLTPLTDFGRVVQFTV